MEIISLFFKIQIMHVKHIIVRPIRMILLDFETSPGENFRHTLKIKMHRPE
jgi:hypothetical protein